MDRFSTLLTEAFSLNDLFALVFFALGVHALTLVIERKNAARKSTARMMAQRRMRWMREMAARDVRIKDAQLLAIQHRGAAFFTSACMLSIGGCVALLGAADQLIDIASDFTDSELENNHRRAVWEIKILFTLSVLVLALMKFIWAHRLFGYCAILMGATPSPDDEDRISVAIETAALNINGGRSFNRGLRLIYFALATLAWMLGPLAFALATLMVLFMLVRREYFSDTHRVLANSPLNNSDRD